MAHPQLTLTYFDVTGRAELTRLVLRYGGISFVDNRITQVQFEELKPTLPLGQVPVLEVDGETFAQSIAFARYAAKLAGLYPSDPVEALRVDMLVDTLSEIIEPIVNICFYEKDETLKAQKTKRLHEETLPNTLQALENMVQGAFFIGDSSTLADILLLDVVENRITLVPPPFGIEEYPKLEAIVAKVKAHPGVAAYLARQ